MVLLDFETRLSLGRYAGSLVRGSYYRKPMNDSRWNHARHSRWNAAPPAAKWEMGMGMAALRRQEAGRERRAANAHLSAPSADERSRRGKRSQPSNSNTKSSPMGFWLFRARRGCEQSQQQRGPGEAPPLQSPFIDSGDISVRLAEEGEWVLCGNDCGNHCMLPNQTCGCEWVEE